MSVVSSTTRFAGPVDRCPRSSETPSRRSTVQVETLKPTFARSTKRWALGKVAMRTENEEELTRGLLEMFTRHPVDGEKRLTPPY